jgi:hypothetical protein
LVALAGWLVGWCPREIDTRLAAIRTQSVLVAFAGELFESSALAMLPAIMTVAGSLCHKQKIVRDAAGDLVTTIVDKLNAHALPLYLADLFQGCMQSP